MKDYPTEQATILVVDDNLTNLGVLIDALRKTGFKILIAQDGEDAIQQAEYASPDIILLDVKMPGIDGFETCRRLKEIEVTREIPVIFMTALSETVDKVTGFQAGGVDYLTKPLQHEEVLARVEAHLTIRRLQQQFQEQNRQLRELNASKDAFFSIIAHDLRNPLSSLHELTQIIEENLDTYSQPDLKEMIVLQKTAAENLYRLLENLLTWSRFQRGLIAYQPQPIDLKWLVTKNISLLALQAGRKQIMLHNTVQSGIRIYADLNMIDTVIRNLISNAIKFTQQGGKVEMIADQRESEVEVAVADTGIGIGPEYLSKLFRIDVKYKRLGTAQEEGTGLGLILCKEFIERHHGKIWVESELNKGTIFRFTLPKAPSSP